MGSRLRFSGSARDRLAILRSRMGRWGLAGTRAGRRTVHPAMALAQWRLTGRLTRLPLRTVVATRAGRCQTTVLRTRRGRLLTGDSVIRQRRLLRLGRMCRLRAIAAQAEVAAQAEQQAVAAPRALAAQAVRVDLRSARVEAWRVPVEAFWARVGRLFPEASLALAGLCPTQQSAAVVFRGPAAEPAPMPQLARPSGRATSTRRPTHRVWRLIAPFARSLERTAAPSTS